MNVLLTYLGTNRECYSRFSSLSDDKIQFCSTVKELFDFVKENIPEESVLIFFEKNDIEIDIPLLKEIREKISLSYIILVADHIPKDQFRRYMQNGVRDTACSNVTKERIKNGIQFIERNHKFLCCSYKEQLPLGNYKIPFWKRLFDVIFSLFALIVLSPFLIIVSIFIRIESPGPIIYRSKRVGSNYKEFDFFKFRSMFKDADKRLKEFLSLNQYNDVDLSNFNVNDDTARIPVSTTEIIGSNSTDSIHGGLYFSDDDIISEEDFIREKIVKQQNNFVKFENDPRITRMGHFIRKYSIDELPQLINILKGDMSIVGNRPLPLYEAEQLTSDQYIDRFLGPAGLTGLWQVEKRGDSGKLSPEERKQLDIYYAKHFSFWLDLKIILRTFAAFIQKENV